MRKVPLCLGVLAAMAVVLGGDPALAQSIDLSPVTTLLQGIIDTITGPLGIAIATLAGGRRRRELAVRHHRLPPGHVRRGRHRHCRRRGNHHLRDLGLTWRNGPRFSSA